MAPLQGGRNIDLRIEPVIVEEEPDLRQLAKIS
jgi:hypothetical protein